jgi:8-oxo-dGTP pyrophosphatase MutT (NUDIX family)
MGSEEPRKRLRATAVLVRGGKVLLVRDSGKHHFSLPGGGIEKSEPAINAAVREIWEELGLVAVKVERIRECDHVGSVNDHHVCLIQADGNPRLRGHELDAFHWWDMKESIPVLSHVKAILAGLDELGKLNRL